MRKRRKRRDGLNFIVKIKSKRETTPNIPLESNVEEEQEVETVERERAAPSKTKLVVRRVLSRLMRSSESDSDMYFMSMYTGGSFVFFLCRMCMESRGSAAQP